MANAGGLKAAAKRTAFGDVSNTVNANRPSRDDSVISSKTGYEVIEKAISLQQDMKAVALLRPAQRPLSVSGLKGLLNNVTNSSATGTTKATLIDVQPAPQPANTRKVLTKRNTTVFKDQIRTQPEQSVSNPDKPMPSTTSTAPVHQELLSQLSHSERSEEPQPKLRRTQSKYIAESQHQQAAQETSSTSMCPRENVMVRSDGAYIDEEGNLRLCQYTEETDTVDEPGFDTNNGVLLPQPLTEVRLEAKVNSGAMAHNEIEQPAAARKHVLPPVSEPEEYWEQDEDEENYDEEGYVTARSFKSRGDNTTGGATTVLFPKINQKVKKELATAKQLIESTRTIEEIEDEAWDTSMVAEYGDEIFQYMRDLEIKMLPNAHYMDNQAEIQWSMRSVLMDWLVQVHHRFGLLPETLFLCVNYIDRFLSCKIVSLGKLQLVGATAIFVAAKYEEINCPSVQEIVYMVDGGYTVDEILKAERFMLSMLQFELGWPGPMSFLRRISKADDYDLETRTLAKYFLEITIMDERFVGSPPSFAAAGAHCLARMMLKKGNWSQAHIYYSNYTYAQLYTLVLLMVESCENPQKHHGAIFDKYSDKRYKRASLFVQNEMRKGFTLLDIATNNTATTAPMYDDKQIWDRM
ncbi:hypothetical protein MMC24_006904 [Lignoscripta atroalba]|nr:hypothetical protein [Lignoscripta atroalba]